LCAARWKAGRAGRAPRPQWWAGHTASPAPMRPPRQLHHIGERLFNPLRRGTPPEARGPAILRALLQSRAQRTAAGCVRGISGWFSCPFCTAIGLPVPRCCGRVPRAPRSRCSSPDAAAPAALPIQQDPLAAPWPLRASRSWPPSRRRWRRRAKGCSPATRARVGPGSPAAVWAPRPHDRQSCVLATCGVAKCCSGPRSAPGR
jgi:hypothetical protein